MPIALLILGILGLRTSGPLDGLGKHPVLRGFTEEVGTFPLVSQGGTILARKSYSDGVRRLTVDAVSFRRGTDLAKVIYDRNWGRQGAACPIPLPEFEKRGFTIHYVAQPKYIETDVTSGRIWIQIGLSRGKTTKSTVMDSRQKIADDLRADTKSCKLLFDLLPEIEKLAKQAN